MANAPASTKPTPTRVGIKSRKPTGVVEYPLVLLSGEEFAGKSLIAAVATRDERIGATYWFDLGEGQADSYSVLPGTRYEVIEHDGTYRDILEQTTAVWHEAARAEDAGEPPVMMVVDTVTAEWSMLVDWTNDRARRSRNGQRILNQDPDAEVDPAMNLWNDATKRHKRLMTLWMTFPGICVLTARGKTVTVVKDGKPTEESIDKPEGQKGLAYDVDAWFWATREPREVQLRGVRSLKILDLSADLPYVKVGPWDVFDLATWVFDDLGAHKGKRENLTTLAGDQLDGVFDLVATAPDLDHLRAIWERLSANLTGPARDDLWRLVSERREVLQRQETAPVDPTDTEAQAAALAQAAAGMPDQSDVAANDPALDPETQAVADGALETAQQMAERTRKPSGATR